MIPELFGGRIYMGEYGHVDLLVKEDGKPEPPKVEKSWQMKGTCERGERADLTGCSPATGETSSKPQKFNSFKRDAVKSTIEQANQAAAAIVAKSTEAQNRIKEITGRDLNAVKVVVRKYAQALSRAIKSNLEDALAWAEWEWESDPDKSKQYFNDRIQLTKETREAAFDDTIGDWLESGNRFGSYGPRMLTAMEELFLGGARNDDKPEPPKVEKGIPFDRFQLAAAWHQADLADAMLESEIKAGFTGTRRDRAGRNVCWADGTRVPCSNAQQSNQTKPQQRDEPKTKPKNPKVGGESSKGQQISASKNGKIKVMDSPQKPPPTPEMSEKAARAKATHKMVNKDIQRYAEEYNEPRFAEVVKGKSYPDSEPVDVVYAHDGKENGVELKTMVDNSNGKITMDSYAQVRKIEWEREHGGNFHTVVSDDHAVFNANGEGQHDDSQRRYYYRRGVAGSARVAGMYLCKDEAELKKLMALPEEELPPAAQRTDAKLRVGRWKFFTDNEGKGYKNSKTGKIVRPKK